MTPFDVLKTDIDDFILLCNYLCGLNSEAPTPPQTVSEREESAAFWAAL